MKAAGLASFTDFKGHLENFRTNGHLLCPPTTSNNADSIISLTLPDVINGSSSASKSSEGVHTYVSAAFDEDYEVNDEEEVKTPRMSPTLNEIKKKLTHWKPSSKPLYPAVDPSRTDSTGSTPRSLVDAFHKQCPYPLDKLYDESIPVQSRRSLKDNIRLNVEKCAMVDKVALTGRAFTNHSSTLRRLESILTCPSSPLPRLMSYSSSSGSLIGNVSGLSLQPDELVMGDTIFSPLPPPATVKTFLKDSEVDPAKSEPNSVLSSVSDPVTSGTYEKVENGCDVESIGCYVNNANTEQPIGDSADMEDEMHDSGQVQPVTNGSSNLNPLAKNGVKHIDTNCASDRSNTDVPSRGKTRSHRKQAKTKSTQSAHVDSSQKQKPNDTKKQQEIKHSPKLSSEDLSDCVSSKPDEQIDSTQIVTNGEVQPARADTPKARLPLVDPPVVGGAVTSHAYEESDPPDDDFTLVMNKKHRRKQKQQNKSELTAHPTRIAPAVNKKYYPNNSRLSVVTTQPFSFNRSFPPYTRPPINSTYLKTFHTDRVASQGTAPPVRYAYAKSLLRKSPPRSPESGSTFASISSAPEWGNLAPPTRCTKVTVITPNKLQKSPISFSQGPTKMSDFNRKPAPAYPRLNSSPPVAIPTGQHQLVCNFLLKLWRTFEKPPINL
ncbi:hypothetical protein AHF37_08437 [Paragonimus kellicotti]|nr:hypothetical protein AHF37_08437 [Paragonimus kellicotti]